METYLWKIKVYKARIRLLFTADALASKVEERDVFVEKTHQKRGDKPWRTL